MGWKEFFKPTIGKIILTIAILLLVVVSVFYFDGGSGGRCWGEYAKNDLICKIADYVAIIIFFPLVITNELVEMSKLFILYYTVLILYLYFLSCLIIYIYNKIKSRRKKK